MVTIPPVTEAKPSGNQLVIDNVVEDPVLTDADAVTVTAGEFGGFGWVEVVAKKLNGALNASGHCLIEGS